jgi:crossover junction endodeoxyribonuclease RuvC
MIAIGIDPGKRGAIVGLSPQGAAVRLLSSVYAGSDVVPALLVAALYDVRESLGNGTAYVGVENQQAMPRQGVASTFRLGANFGRICGVVESLGWSVEYFRPREWRKRAGITIPRGGDPKAATIAAVSARLPEVDLIPGRLRVPHDGIADAAGLALATRSAWAQGKP